MAFYFTVPTQHVVPVIAQGLGLLHVVELADKELLPESVVRQAEQYRAFVGEFVELEEIPDDD